MDNFAYNLRDKIIKTIEKGGNKNFLQEYDDGEHLKLYSIEPLNNIGRNNFEARIIINKEYNTVGLSAFLNLLIPKHKKERIMEFLFERNNSIFHGTYCAYLSEYGYNIDLRIFFPVAIARNLSAETILEYLALYANTLENDIDTFQQIIYSE